MESEERKKININDLKISKSRKDGFSNNQYSFAIPNNFEIKYDIEDRDFVVYSKDSGEWENSFVVVYSGDVTPFEEIENSIHSINALLLIQEFSYWNTTYDEFKMLFGGS